MTNTTETLGNALDCINFALDMGFVPKNSMANGFSSGGVYRHDRYTVALLVVDVEACEFKVVAYEPLWLEGRVQCGPELYSMMLTNLPAHVFCRQLEGVLINWADLSR